MGKQCAVCKEGCHELSAAEVYDRLEKVCQLIEVVGLDLLAGLMRLKEESKRNRGVEGDGQELQDSSRQSSLVHECTSALVADGNKCENGERVAVGNGQSEIVNGRDAGGCEKDEGGQRRREGGGRETGDGGGIAPRGLGAIASVKEKGRDRQGRPSEGPGEARFANKLRIIKDGEVLEYGGKTYCFGGAKRWGYLRRLIEAQGGYVALGCNLKSYFANNAQAKAFCATAVEPEGSGCKGTGRYRLKF